LAPKLSRARDRGLCMLPRAATFLLPN
jgi:hypothetical protein